MRTEHLRGTAAVFCVAVCALAEQRTHSPSCTAFSDLFLNVEAFAPLGGEGWEGKEKSGFIKSGIAARLGKQSFFFSLPDQL